MYMKLEVYVWVNVRENYKKESNKMMNKGPYIPYIEYIIIRWLRFLWGHQPHNDQT